jgi:hypothetical protein
MSGGSDSLRGLPPWLGASSVGDVFEMVLQQGLAQAQATAAHTAAAGAPPQQDGRLDDPSGAQAAAAERNPNASTPTTPTGSWNSFTSGGGGEGGGAGSQGDVETTAGTGASDDASEAGGEVAAAAGQRVAMAGLAREVERLLAVRQQRLRRGGGPGSAAAA